MSSYHRGAFIVDSTMIKIKWYDRLALNISHVYSHLELVLFDARQIIINNAETSLPPLKVDETHTCNEEWFFQISGHWFPKFSFHWAIRFSFSGRDKFVKKGQWFQCSESTVGNKKFYSVGPAPTNYSITHVIDHLILSFA